MKRILVLLAVIILVYSCSSSMPKWYTEKDNFFPESEYLLAKGYGITPEKAVEDAIVELSRIFGTKVSVEKDVLERYESISDSDNMDLHESYYEFSTEFTKFISEQNLVNVRYMDPVREKRGLYFTVAYLERDKTANILMNRLERLEESINFHVKASNASLDVIEKYRHLNAAWLSAAKETMMQEQLDVLAPGMSLKMKYSMEALAKMKSKTADLISFNIRSIKSPNKHVKQAIAKVINDNGFKVLEGTAMMTVNYHSDMKEIDIHQDMLVFVAWDFDIKMRDWKKQTLLSIYEQGREGSLDRYNAELHAIEHIQKYIDTEFRDEFNTFFDSVEE